MPQWDLPVWDVNELEPGDKVFVAEPALSSYRLFRYSIYKEYTVSRITPKKTKVYAVIGDKEKEFAVNKTVFYKDSSELQERHLIAKYARACSRILNNINNHEHDLYSVTDVEFATLYEHLKAADNILRKQK